METLSRLRSLLSQQFGIPEESVKPNTPFENLGLDSLELVDLVISIEEEFGVEVDDDKLDKIKHIDDIIKFIENFDV